MKGGGWFTRTKKITSHDIKPVLTDFINSTNYDDTLYKTLEDYIQKRMETKASKWYESIDDVSQCQ
jgi:hypothetical protein